MPDETAQGHYTCMEPRPSSDANAIHMPNGRMRVAVWSPYKRLESALHDLIVSLPGVEAVELKGALPFRQTLRQHGVTIVVLDVDGSPGTARELIGQIRESGDELKVLALSAHGDRRFVESALQSGVTGYVLKDRAFEDLPDAVRAAAKSMRFVSPAAHGPDEKQELPNGV